MPPDAHDFATACQTAMERLPVTSRPWSRGWCGAVAGILEAATAKPGNVFPGRPFPDLDFRDLVAAAVATIPALESAPRSPLGETILAAVRSGIAVTRSNANLGIVLLLAPLATAAPRPTPDAVEAVLSGLGPADAAAIWEAIALARPGMALTLNGIAQGFIADRVARLLQAEGLRGVLVDAGELRALGGHPDGGGWPVTLGDGGRRLALRDRALSNLKDKGAA